MRRFALILIAALLAAPSLGQAQDKPTGPTFNAYGFALLHMFYGDAAVRRRRTTPTRWSP